VGVAAPPFFLEERARTEAGNPLDSPVTREAEDGVAGAKVGCDHGGASTEPICAGPVSKIGSVPKGLIMGEMNETKYKIKSFLSAAFMNES